MSVLLKKSLTFSTSLPKYVRIFSEKCLQPNEVKEREPVPCEKIFPGKKYIFPGIKYLALTC